jgi:HlyD family secretion protein
MTELRAPRAGLVIYAKKGGAKSAERIQPGTMVFRGSHLVYLPDVSNMVVDTEVNEIDIRNVKVGGRADVRLEAYPGETFHGEVLEISYLAKLKRSNSGAATGIKVFDVVVKLEEKDPRLKPGLTAALDVIIDHYEDVISVPLSAVRSQSGRHTVFVSNAGKIEARKVVLGPSNQDRVIVKEGLRPGEQVVLSDPSSESS